MHDPDQHKAERRRAGQQCQSPTPNSPSDPSTSSTRPETLAASGTQPSIIEMWIAEQADRLRERGVDPRL